MYPPRGRTQGQHANSSSLSKRRNWFWPLGYLDFPQILLVCDGTENIFQILLREEVWNSTTSDHPVNVDQKLSLTIWESVIRNTVGLTRTPSLQILIIWKWLISVSHQTHSCMPQADTNSVFRSRQLRPTWHFLRDVWLSRWFWNVKYPCLKRTRSIYGIVVIVFHQFGVTSLSAYLDTVWLMHEQPCQHDGLDVIISLKRLR
jgi:hypothetical protein